MIPNLDKSESKKTGKKYRISNTKCRMSKCGIASLRQFRKIKNDRIPYFDIRCSIFIIQHLNFSAIKYTK